MSELTDKLEALAKEWEGGEPASNEEDALAWCAAHAHCADELRAILAAALRDPPGLREAGEQKLLLARAYEFVEECTSSLTDAFADKANKWIDDYDAALAVSPQASGIKRG